MPEYNRLLASLVNIIENGRVYFSYNGRWSIELISWIDKTNLGHATMSCGLHKHQISRQELMRLPSVLSKRVVVQLRFNFVVEYIIDYILKIFIFW
jgi:hypothetical protein